MDVTFYAILLIGLPLLGIIINLIVIQRSLGPAYDKIRFNDADWKEKISGIKGKINVFRLQPVTGIVFGISVLILFEMRDSNLPIEIEDKIILASALLVGFTALFMCISMSIIYQNAIPKIVEKPGTYSKYLVISSISKTAAIYGLLLSTLLFMGVGVIGKTSMAIKLEDAKRILDVCVIFSVLSVFTVLKGYLPTIVKGDLIPIDENGNKRKAKIGWPGTPPLSVQPDPIFSKKIVYAVIPEVPIIIGLLLVILTFNDIGML